MKRVKNIYVSPRKLFLVDSLGAFLSAFMLGVVLVQFEEVFGMPRPVLQYLALAACVFAAYSFFCYACFPNNWKPYLVMIGIVNLVYCCVTLGLVVFLYDSLTLPGLLYFGLEIIIVILLAVVELRMGFGWIE